MTFLLVHGGGHSSACWDPLLPHLAAPAVAIDLPGRGSRPAPLDEVGVADFVAATVGELRTLGSERVVLVGHSMAGLSIPGILAQAADAVAHVAFVSCAIPPDGLSLLSLLAPEFVEMAETIPPSPEGYNQSPEDVRVTQTYDMDERQAEFTISIVVPEASRPALERIDLSGLGGSTPRTWVKLLRDRSFPPELQDVMAIRARCTEVREIDSGHMAMISHPVELAAILNDIHLQCASSFPSK